MNFTYHRLYIRDLNLNYNDALNLLRVSDHSPNNPVVSETIYVFNQLKNIADIHGGYVVYEKVIINKSRGTIHINNKSIHPNKQICDYMKGAEKIALFVCTAGEGFSSYSDKCNKDRDYLKGFISDSLGSMVVEKSMDLIQQKMEGFFSKSGLKITNRYSPGYCNWPTEDQKQLFSLLPDNPCNIQLLNSALMVPIKSVSGIIGIGKNVKKMAYSCSVCKNRTCIFRETSNK